MPCAVKKMKGRISKEQMTEFVREVCFALGRCVSCVRALRIVCMGCFACVCGCVCVCTCLQMEGLGVIEIVPMLAHMRMHSFSCWPFPPLLCLSISLCLAPLISLSISRACALSLSSVLLSSALSMTLFPCLF